MGNICTIAGCLRQNLTSSFFLKRFKYINEMASAATVDEIDWTIMEELLALDEGDEELMPDGPYLQEIDGVVMAVYVPQRVRGEAYIEEPTPNGKARS
jgi:hypothetical protein